MLNCDTFKLVLWRSISVLSLTLAAQLDRETKEAVSDSGSGLTVAPCFYRGRGLVRV